MQRLLSFALGLDVRQIGAERFDTGGADGLRTEAFALQGPRLVDFIALVDPQLVGQLRPMWLGVVFHGAVEDADGRGLFKPLPDPIPLKIQFPIRPRPRIGFWP